VDGHLIGHEKLGRRVFPEKQDMAKNRKPLLTKKGEKKKKKEEKTTKWKTRKPIGSL